MTNKVSVLLGLVAISFLLIANPCARATTQKELDAVKKLCVDRKYEQAAACVRKLLDDDPRNGLLWNYYGKALDSATDSKKAIEAYSQSIAFGYKSWEPYYGRGMAYSHLGNFETAVTDMKAALKKEILNPDTRAAVSCDLADAELSMKRFCDAANDYTMYFKFSTGPDLARYTHRARAYAGCGKLTEAINDMSTYLASSKKLKPRQIVGGYVYRAELYSKTKEYDKAIADLSAALKIDPDRPEFIRQRAKLYDLAGKKDLAEKDRAKAKQIDTNLYGS